MTRITQICADFYFIDKINTFFIFCIIRENPCYPCHLHSFRTTSATLPPNKHKKGKVWFFIKKTIELLEQHTHIRL